ncbi:hypothetical protein R4R86_002191 [Citrobacter farmeri]
MFSYIMPGANNLLRAILFYDPLVEASGHPKSGRSDKGALWGNL